MIEAGSVAELRSFVLQQRDRGARIGFVPTMGNLHAGHLALVKRAREVTDCVVASIYVNPLQFGPQEDYEQYPRSLDADRTALRDAGVELLFTPTETEIYPRGPELQTRVEVPGVSRELCGKARPGHFRGVATVVNRLLHLVECDLAVFGKKDYQQLLIIRWMVADLGMAVEIEALETVRETDGLALSSRNRYLNAQERAAAPRLNQILCQSAETLKDQAGQGWPEIEPAATAELRDAGFQPEYLSLRRQVDLSVPDPADRQLVILAAARLGPTRLIDNRELDLNRPA